MQWLEEEMQEIIVTESNLIHSLLETAVTEIYPQPGAWGQEEWLCALEQLVQRT